ncbi:MAG TPA: hypothetical protein VF810_01375 [Patescibacteria group bacterium]
MQQSYKELLSKILEIINYSNNRDKFIKEFETMNHLEAVTNIVERFPAAVRERIKLVSSGFLKPDLIKHKISPEEYNLELNKVAEAELYKFVQVISPVLTLTQKQKIDQLLRHVVH